MTRTTQRPANSPAGESKHPREQGVGKRRRAREIAIQMLYQRELGGCALDEIFDGYRLYDYLWETEAAESLGEKDSDEPGEPRRLSDAERRQVENAFAYAQKLLQGVEKNTECIDERIREHAENWRLERMPVIDRNILRLAIYEMLFEASVPKVVIVDEAIELAKKFGSENSGRFVNGLLDGVLKAQTGATEAPAEGSATGSAEGSATGPTTGPATGPAAGSTTRPAAKRSRRGRPRADSGSSA